MNNTIGLGTLSQLCQLALYCFFSKPLPIMQMILRFYKTFDFMLKTTKYWYQLFTILLPNTLLYIETTQFYI